MPAFLVPSAQGRIACGTVGPKTYYVHSSSCSTTVLSPATCPSVLLWGPASQPWGGPHVQGVPVSKADIGTQDPTHLILSNHPFLWPLKNSPGRFCQQPSLRSSPEGASNPSLPLLSPFWLSSTPPRMGEPSSLSLPHALRHLMKAPPGDKQAVLYHQL